MQTLAELINLRRQHLVRLANQNGAAGEAQILSEETGYLPRPKGQGAKNLLTALRETGITIKLASFDAIALPAGHAVDFSDLDDIRKHLAQHDAHRDQDRQSTNE